MDRWSVGTAAFVWLLGRVVLGSRWQATEVAPGVWQDAITLNQWMVLWALLAASAFTVAPFISRWPRRLLVLLPLLAWIAWSLRTGTLWPIALALYAGPAVLAWCAASYLRDVVRRR